MAPSWPLGLSTSPGGSWCAIACSRRPSDVWPTLSRLILRVVAAAPTELVGCGVGCGGPIDPIARTVSPLYIPSWSRLSRWQPSWRSCCNSRSLSTPMPEPLRSAEAWCGGAVGVSDFIGVVMGTGVGGGIVSGGQLLQGRVGNAGYIGHVVVEPDGRACICGGKGCLETYCSGRAIEAETGRPPQRAPQAIVERTGCDGRPGARLASVRSAISSWRSSADRSRSDSASPSSAAAQDELDKRARLPFTSGFQVMPATLGPAGPVDRRGGAGPATAEALPTSSSRGYRRVTYVHAPHLLRRGRGLPREGPGLSGREAADQVGRHRPARRRGAHRPSSTEWRATLFAAGYLAPGWPTEYGGAGLSALEQVIIAEEFAKAGVPTGGPNDVFGIQMLGNTLLKWGTDEQKNALPAADPLGRRHMVSGLLRAERRQRPLQHRAARRARRRPVGAQRSEDLDVRRSSRRPHLHARCVPTPMHRGTRASRSSWSTCVSRVSRCVRSR